MGKFKTGVAKFVANKFLSNEMNQIKEGYRNQEIQKVHQEIEYYKDVIKKLQEEKIKLSSMKFKEKVKSQSNAKEQSADMQKNNNIENPYADYL